MKFFSFYNRSPWHPHLNHVQNLDLLSSNDQLHESIQSHSHTATPTKEYQSLSPKSVSTLANEDVNTKCSKKGM